MFQQNVSRSFLTIADAVCSLTHFQVDNCTFECGQGKIGRIIIDLLLHVIQFLITSIDLENILIASRVLCCFAIFIEV